MAYFANSTEGECFDKQCSICKYGEKACPIAYVQSAYNYDACNNKVARIILDTLIKNDGTCTMFETFKKDFCDNGEKQSKLF
jgi:hypothetical protein